MDQLHTAGDAMLTPAAILEPLRQRYLALWWQADGRPEPQQTYQPAEQQRREGVLDRFLAVVKAESRVGGVLTRNSSEAVQQHLAAAFGTFATDALDFERADLDAVFGSGIVGALGAFARQARAFDPGISGEDIFQASRNVLTMLFLQLLWGLPVALTPAVTAYSLLYPYSDNYLDDPAIDAATKAKFSRRFRARLEGAAIEAGNDRERAIFALVDQIGEQYRPSRDLAVYESLLAIHAAQERSVRLMRRGASPYEVDVLGLAIEKGGASVLADAYLVKPALDPAEADVAFGMGALLQLGDDLQDVEADRVSGLQTVFSQTAPRWPLDRVTDRCLVLGAAVLRGADAFAGASAASARSLMNKSTLRLFVDAAGQAAHLYTPRYVAELEQRSPFRFAALRRRRRGLVRLQASLPDLLQRLAP
jgi:hypothetical protein